ncbi:MAG: hypothetical protein AAF962_23270 [Actinomycetota bacterium]
MITAIVFAVILVVVIPVGFLMTTTIAAAAIGELLRFGAEKENADSELIDLNT